VKLVVVESPYAHAKDDTQQFVRVILYLRACLRDCLFRGEAPFASHAIYAQPGVLDDHIPEQRELGIEAGFAWGVKAELRAVYTDMGISPGMLSGIDEARKIGQEVEYRTVPDWKKETT
jgi:hypothetical protein